AHRVRPVARVLPAVGSLLAEEVVAEVIVGHGLVGQTGLWAVGTPDSEGLAHCLPPIRLPAVRIASECLTILGLRLGLKPGVRVWSGAGSLSPLLRARTPRREPRTRELICDLAHSHR